jgi:hypothetical protein
MRNGIAQRLPDTFERRVFRALYRSVLGAPLRRAPLARKTNKQTIAAGQPGQTAPPHHKGKAVMKTFAILTTALALGTGIGMSQPGPGWHPGGPPGRGHHPFDLILRALDANTNGVLEADELANAPAALLKLDKNGDGKLSADELRPPMPPGTNQFRMHPPPGGHPPVSPLMAALDTNGDGELDATEIANATTSLLKLDTNGDGQLTPDELRPKRPDGPGGPGHVGSAHESDGPAGPENLAGPPGPDEDVGPGDLPPPDEPGFPGEPLPPEDQ